MSNRATTLSRRAALALPALLLARPAAALILPERVSQGSLVTGRADPGTRVTFEGRNLRVSPDGLFVFGLKRDAEPQATLTITAPNGHREERRITVTPREWDIQRLEGLPGRMVTPDAEALARIRAEQERLNAARRTNTATPHFAEGLEWPTRGRISGVYGSQRILNGQPRAPHLGLDVAVPTGTPLAAAATGRVTLAGDLYFTGNTLLIEHGHGVTTLYAHMSRLDVREGEAVSRGQVIGASGATGRVTGPHLHLALFWLATPVDPRPLLP
ncbi:M23 family metallopeptidase [Roseomonas xinghualingensis]|uniref:M23 family metallopeptidase n=1 Tax=Roseomonas xinghualingensis TaxID=2986475 RepID=UPI0021F2303A|nr:M23 family metallopeptidase [Roseomonas sp. SXEYE001]MCV4205886.1 M23 family metallopeptidase [Roseomonas sp. SXEYE001]